MNARSTMLMLLATTLFGCAQPAGPGISASANASALPAPPERTRVQYVGQLSDQAPISSHRRILARASSEAIFGKKKIASMLSPYALCTDGANRPVRRRQQCASRFMFSISKTRKYAQWKPTAGEKRFAQPVGIAYDPAGKLFVSDSAARCIYVFDNSGRTIGVIGAGCSGAAVRAGV
jgi:hypothetical protein